MTDTLTRIDGVVIGKFLGFGDTAPLVIFAGNPLEIAMPAASLVDMSSSMIGADVALLFQDGDPSRPLIVGRIVDPSKRSATPKIVQDGKRVVISGEESIELRCGKSTILMESNGHITIRGRYVTSHATVSNRVRGGTVNLN